MSKRRRTTLPVSDLMIDMCKCNNSKKFDAAKFVEVLRTTDPNSVSDGESPKTLLQMTILSWNTEAMSLLLEAKANPNWKGNPETDSHPLIDALRAQHCDVEDVVKLLLEHKADPNPTDRHSGAYPLHVACDSPMSVVTALVEAGSEIHPLDNSGLSPFVWAFQNQHWRFCEYILGLDFVRPAELSAQAVCSPVYFPKPEPFVKQLCEENRLPLERALEQRLVLLTEFLLLAGSPLETIDQGEIFPFIFTALKSGPDFVRTLVKFNADVNTVFRSRPLLYYALALNVVGPDGIFSCDLPLVQTLLDLNASVEKNSLSWISDLYMGCDRYEVTHTLLLASADPAERTDQGDPALHVAVNHDSLRTVELLLAHHADPMQQNAKEHTPLELAVSAGSFQIINFLTSPQVWSVRTDPDTLVVLMGSRYWANVVHSVISIVEDSKLENLVSALSKFIPSSGVYAERKFENELAMLLVKRNRTELHKYMQDTLGFHRVVTELCCSYLTDKEDYLLGNQIGFFTATEYVCELPPRVPISPPTYPATQWF
jgi:ankyrin repeat protein